MNNTTTTTAAALMTTAGLNTPMARSLAQNLDRDADDFADVKRRMLAKLASATNHIDGTKNKLNRNYVPDKIMWIEMTARDLVELKRQYDMLAERMSRTIHTLTVEIVDPGVAESLRDIAFGSTDGDRTVTP